MMTKESSATRKLIDQFKKASEEAEDSLKLEEYQQAMALFFEASQAADEMCERFITLLIRTAPSPSHRILLVEVLAWRLRYYTAQYDYHLSVAQTLRGLPREEWIARLETILVLSQSLVTKLIPILKQADDVSLRRRIQKVLDDWVTGIRSLVEKLRSWRMASSQASRVLEWALDNDLENLVKF
ncbi:MAG: hypothetical protein GF411_11250 [Candidatus Lokiarchaeota archaeon]|nr:hypothetical protein [Candidatus Lokiarchaeota archaeon]